jgi:hypothetical protein
LHDAESTFRQKVTAIGEGLSSLERTYQAEHAKQQQLLQEAAQNAN